jgi:hypothetical protein
MTQCHSASCSNKFRADSWVHEPNSSNRSSTISVTWGSLAKGELTTTNFRSSNLVILLNTATDQLWWDSEVYTKPSVKSPLFSWQIGPYSWKINNFRPLSIVEGAVISRARLHYYSSWGLAFLACSSSVSTTILGFLS